MFGVQNSRRNRSEQIIADFLTRQKNPLNDMLLFFVQTDNKKYLKLGISGILGRLFFSKDGKVLSNVPRYRVCM